MKMKKKRGRPRKNIPNNFRGKEDRFWSKIVKGLKKFLESPFKQEEKWIVILKKHYFQ